MRDLPTFLKNFPHNNGNFPIYNAKIKYNILDKILYYINISLYKEFMTNFQKIISKLHFTLKKISLIVKLLIFISRK